MKSYVIEKNEEKNVWAFKQIDSDDKINETEFESLNRALENLTMIYTYNLVEAMLKENTTIEKINIAMATYYKNIVTSAVKLSKQNKNKKVVTDGVSN